MREKYGIAERTIEKRIADYKWIKGQAKPLIEKSIAEKNIELFAKAGMTEDKVIEKIAEGIRDDDAGIRYRYIQEYHKLCGTYAPTKREVTGKDGKDFMPVPKTQQDIDAELKELLGQ